MDPQEMFRRLMMGQGQAPAAPAPAPAPGVAPPAGAAPPPEASNEDILKSILLSPSGAGTGARPDPIGGMNHQGRALEAFKTMASGGK